MNRTDLEQTDSDDSAFLVNPSGTKRKAGTRLFNTRKQPKQINTNKYATRSSLFSSSTSTEGQAKLEKTLGGNVQQGCSGSKEPDSMEGAPEDANITKPNKKSSCPLCLKKFENTSSHISHMKQCAKKKKLTTQQLLDAMNLQDKHEQERISLGLTAAPTKSKLYKKPERKLRDNFDELSLAIAMSRSLEETPASSSSVPAQNMTLETFGFTTSNNIVLPNIGRKKSKHVHLGDSVLKLRTKEDRDKLMTEKAALILLDEENASTVPCGDAKSPCGNPTPKERLKCQTAVSKLWQLGESDKGRQWYVDGLRDMMGIEPSPTPQLVKDITAEIAKLRLPRRHYHEHWRKLINVKKLSDLEAVTSEGTVVYLHQVVLYARSPVLLEACHENMFSQFPYSVVKVFLEFLYCGVVDSLQHSQISSLLSLAEAVKYDDLTTVLKELQHHLSNSHMASDSSEGMILSSLTPPHPGSSHTCDHRVDSMAADDLINTRLAVVLRQPNQKCHYDVDTMTADTQPADLTDTQLAVALRKPSQKCHYDVDTMTADTQPADLTNTQLAVALRKPSQICHYDVDTVTADTQPDTQVTLRLPRVSAICCREFEVDPVVDLTQSSHESSPRRLEQAPHEMSTDEDESNMDKSYWSIIQQDRKKKDLETLQDQEEIKENLSNSKERDKIDFIMKKQKEKYRMDLDKSQREDEEMNLKNRMELDKILRLSNVRCDELDKDMFEDEKEEERLGHDEELIVLSSDSELPRDDKAASTDDEDTERVFNADVPFYDPYEYDRFDLQYSPPREMLLYEWSPPRGDSQPAPPSQSLISPSITRVVTPTSSRPCATSTPDASNIRSVTRETSYPTPLSSNKRSTRKNAGRRMSHQHASSSKRIVNGLASYRAGSGRRSLRRLPNSTLNTINSRKKRKSHLTKQQVAALLTDSILDELKASMLDNDTVEPKAATSSPSHSQGRTETGRRFVEVTPQTSGVRYIEKVTPLPDYSGMEDALLKKHLEKYGLKKGLGRKKAKKILRHIYEELHPVINTQNNKIIKFLSTQKKTKKRECGKGTKGKSSKAKRKLNNSLEPDKERETESKRKELADEAADTDKESSRDVIDGNVESSDDSESEGVAPRESDVATAVQQYLLTHPQLHHKILQYEPIWLEELRRELKMSCNMNVKLTALMEYLDKECITFKSEAQKKNNIKRNEKKKASPKKSPLKKSPSKKTPTKKSTSSL